MTGVPQFLCVLCIAAGYSASGRLAAETQRSPDAEPPDSGSAPVTESLRRWVLRLDKDDGKAFAPGRHNMLMKATDLSFFLQQEQSQGENRADRRRMLILLQGEYYSDIAHGALGFAHEIDLRLPGKSGSCGDPSMVDYPCALALAKIGYPSIAGILERLEDARPAEHGWASEISEKAIELYARVLLQVYREAPKAAGGDDEAFAVVERAKLRAPENRRANHQRLLAKLRELSKHRTVEGGPKPAVGAPHRPEKDERAPQIRPGADRRAMILRGSNEQAMTAFLYLQQTRRNDSLFLLSHAKREPKDRPDRWRRGSLIMLLGQYYSTEAIRFLVSHADEYHFAEVASLHEMDIMHYKCALALIDIGRSSVPWILQRLEDVPGSQISEKAMELYARVLLPMYYASPRAAGGFEEAITVVERAKNRAPKNRRANHDRLLTQLRELAKDPRWAPGKR